MADYFYFYSYLYIARANDPPIVRYNPADDSIKEFKYEGGSAQSISVDEYDNVIYWANFKDSMHRIMKTLMNGQTVDLNITYSGTVELATDVFNLYILDQDSNYIHKYLKSSLEKQGNITYDVAIFDIIISYGEYVATIVFNCFVCTGNITQ